MLDLLDVPRAPRDLAHLGIPESLIQDIILRRTLFEGRTSTLRLSMATGLSLVIMSKMVEELRDQRLVEIMGLDGYDHIFELSQAGREAATERLGLCRYAGYAPVSLADYVEVVRKQTARPVVSPSSVRDAFDDLVVNEQLLSELGPALLTTGATFLYGPPGTGKTSIAERLIRVHRDPVLVPRAVEVDSQIITVFDPVIHRPLDEQPENLDPRWVLCHRPSVIVGGELTLSMMDLTYEPANGVYLAPIQMQANNGILVIDDFGRQTITPEQVLNRWIVPLDRHIDYLSLSYGVRFEIPFDAKVVFSTNLAPATLGDEAFFRRIQNKILVAPITDDEFDLVLSRAAAHAGVVVETGAPEHLRHVSRERGDGDLRPYLPIEMCRILNAVCEFNGWSSVLRPDTIDRVAGIYFTKDRVRDQPIGPAAVPALQRQPAHLAPSGNGNGGNGNGGNGSIPH